MTDSRTRPKVAPRAPADFVQRLKIELFSLQLIVRACRDILLLIQNDQREASIMSRVLSVKNVENLAMSNFLNCLSEMVEYAKCVVTLPYSTHLTEIDSLCGSIFMSQKLQKTIRKIQGTLDEVHANHA